MILLTFTGSHDPFPPSARDGDASVGPVLTVCAEREFEQVYLFATPRMAEISKQTRQEITARYPKTAVSVLDVPLKDPTNYLGILRLMRKHFSTIRRKHPSGRYSIAVSSGTPQMHACWLMLAASGEIPATILQTFPPEFVSQAGSCVREIDVLAPDFPKVVLRETGSGADEAPDLTDACRELGIIGNDPSFEKSLKEAAAFAEYDDIHVLLLGETGTGKECFTRLIHRLSGRASKPLVTVNCSAIPSDLMESHLFGHKKGSFTGATDDHAGKFLAADGGVLFLDELGELSLAAQAKLLRTLDQGEIEPLGHANPKHVNVRVIAATNRNLREMVADGTFRQDLYQRFGAVVSIPSLRQRTSDIPQLASHLMEEWNRRNQKQRSLAPKALASLQRYLWPGNIRELRRVIQQSAMLTAKPVLSEKDLRIEEVITSDPSPVVPEPAPGFDINAYLDSLKRKIVARAMDKADRVQARAARMLGWSPQALHQYLKQK